MTTADRKESFSSIYFFPFSDGKVLLREYDSSPTGMVQSWLERFAGENEQIDDILRDLSLKDQPYFSTY